MATRGVYSLKIYSAWRGRRPDSRIFFFFLVWWLSIENLWLVLAPVSLEGDMAIYCWPATPRGKGRGSSWVGGNRDIGGCFGEVVWSKVEWPVLPFAKRQQGLAGPE